MDGGFDFNSPLSARNVNHKSWFAVGFELVFDYLFGTVLRTSDSSVQSVEIFII